MTKAKAAGKAGAKTVTRKAVAKKSGGKKAGKPRDEIADEAQELLDSVDLSGDELPEPAEEIHDPEVLAPELPSDVIATFETKLEAISEDYRPLDVQSAEIRKLSADATLQAYLLGRRLVHIRDNWDALDTGRFKSFRKFLDGGLDIVAQTAYNLINICEQFRFDETARIGRSKCTELLKLPKPKDPDVTLAQAYPEIWRRAEDPQTGYRELAALVREENKRSGNVSGRGTKPKETFKIKELRGLDGEAKAADPDDSIEDEINSFVIPLGPTKLKLHGSIRTNAEGFVERIVWRITR